MRSEQLKTGISIPPRPGRPPAAGKDSDEESGEPLQVTWAGMVWVATVAALVVLSLLIVLILQNQDLVQVQYLGLSGSLPLGVGLFIAAVAGGLLVAVAGAVRITQLRRAAAHTRRRRTPGTPSATQPHVPLLQRRHHA
jgi:uncharacterized integral membrane protein